MKSSYSLGIVGAVLLFVVMLQVATVVPDTPNHKVVRVIDGDTIVVEAPYLPRELGNTLSLRIYGIDTPEKGYRAKCALEKSKSEEARKFTQDRISNATNIQIVYRRWDKYGGRVLGDLVIDGEPLSKSLVNQNLAVSYSGSGPKKNWCSE